MIRDSGSGGAALTLADIDSYIQSNREHWTKVKESRVRCRLAALFDYLPDGKIMTCSTLDEWAEHLRRSGLSDSTVREYIIAANGFLKQTGRNDLRKRNGNVKDLTGKRFGRLTVMKRDTSASGGVTRNARWLCRCSCGKTVSVPGNELMRGSWQSCGCMRAEQLYKNNGYVDGTCLSMVLSDTLRSDNTSGCRGVSRKAGKWIARITYKKKTYHLGTYTSFEDAVKARQRAEETVREDAQQLLLRYGAPRNETA